MIGFVSTISEVLNPDFLLRDALVGSVLLGAVCPLVGVYFVLRRMIFLGVALPQISAAGIAAVFWLYSIFSHDHSHGGGDERSLALAGSLTVTIGSLLILAVLEARNRLMTESRIGSSYAIAGAATILFLAADPGGESQMVAILKGDILATNGQSLAFAFWCYGIAALVLILLRRPLALVSFDRELAAVLGYRTWLWDVALFLIVGAVLSLGVMSAGPLVVFGFLILPPLAVRSWVTRMEPFVALSAVVGAVSAFIGFVMAYHFDLPLGPSETMTAAAAYFLSVAASSILKWKRLSLASGPREAEI
jgi:ABC-type Mn2+/Zn2+ transport system permease subunit